MGYCYGGKYVCRYLKKEGMLDVGFMAHPTMVEGDELRGVKGPLSIAAAGKLCVVSRGTDRGADGCFSQGRCVQHREEA